MTIIESIMIEVDRIAKERNYEVILAVLNYKPEIDLKWRNPWFDE
jgi:hypothetical protein